MSDLKASVGTAVPVSNRQVIDIAIQLAVGAVFVVASFRILHPFIDVIVAGGVIAIAVYPLFLKAVKRLGGRRKTVVALFALIGLGVIVVPVVLASSSLFESAHDLSEQVSDGVVKVPPPPPKVREWPVVGTKIHEFWLQASTSLKSFVERYNDQMKGVVGTMVAAVANAGAQLLRFIFCVLIAAIFLANAEACTEGMGLFSRRLSSARVTAGTSTDLQLRRSAVWPRACSAWRSCRPYWRPSAWRSPACRGSGCGRC